MSVMLLHSGAAFGNWDSLLTAAAIFGVCAMMCFLPGRALVVCADGLRGGTHEVRAKDVVLVQSTGREMGVGVVKEDGSRKWMHIANAEGRFEVGAADLMKVLSGLWGMAKAEEVRVGNGDAQNGPATAG